MLSPKVTDENKYEVCIILSTPKTNTPSVLSMVLSEDELNNSILQVQAVRRVKNDVYDFQETHTLKSFISNPINRTKTGIPCQSEWKIKYVF